MSNEPTLHFIYLESQMLLSKKRYSGWNAIQDDFDDYKTLISPTGPPYRCHNPSVPCA